MAALRGGLGFRIAAFLFLCIFACCFLLLTFQLDREELLGPPAWRLTVKLGRIRAPPKKTRIPQQLVLTSKDGSIASLPSPVQRNVRHTLALNPWFSVRWLGDIDCERYLVEHYNHTDLPHYFANEKRGSYRSDVCRAAVLAREGGFYTDLDVEMKWTFEDLAGEATTFLASFSEDGSVLNAMMGTVANSSFMQEMLQQLVAWYRGEPVAERFGTTSEWMGPVAALAALKAVTARDCPGKELQDVEGAEIPCGPHVVRMFQERALPCWLPEDPDCPPLRYNNYFDGVRYGIYVPPLAPSTAAACRILTAYMGLLSPGPALRTARTGDARLENVMGATGGVGESDPFVRFLFPDHHAYDHQIDFDNYKLFKSNVEQNTRWVGSPSEDLVRDSKAATNHFMLESEADQTISNFLGLRLIGVDLPGEELMTCWLGCGKQIQAGGPFKMGWAYCVITVQDEVADSTLQAVAQARMATIAVARARVAETATPGFSSRRGSTADLADAVSSQLQGLDAVSVPGIRLVAWSPWGPSLKDDIHEEWFVEAIEKVDLPPPWEKRRVRGGGDRPGRMYFLDPRSKRTTWKDPRFLPDSWDQRVDPGSGKVYFQYHKTRKTTYVDPRSCPVGWDMRLSKDGEIYFAYLPAMRTTLIDPRGLPDNFDAALDDSARMYFKNHENQSTTWDDPRSGQQEVTLTKWRQAQSTRWWKEQVWREIEEMNRRKEEEKTTDPGDDPEIVLERGQVEPVQSVCQVLRWLELGWRHTVVEPMTPPDAQELSFASGCHGHWKPMSRLYAARDADASKKQPGNAALEASEEERTSTAAILIAGLVCRPQRVGRSKRADGGEGICSFDRLVVLMDGDGQGPREFRAAWKALSSIGREVHPFVFAAAAHLQRKDWQAFLEESAAEGVAVPSNTSDGLQALQRTVMAKVAMRWAKDPAISCAGKAVLIPSAYALKHCNHKVWATVFERTVEAAKQPLEKTMEFRKIRRGLVVTFFGTCNNETGTATFSKCGLKIFQPVVLYRAWAPRYFQYGHVMSDLLPFVVWIYNNFASNDTKIVVEQDTDGRIKSFMEWFDGKMHERMIYVPADTIVCAEALLQPAPVFALRALW
ncbi:Itch [Symbiodinium microadriaticum]|nr:Itch [Symbiodinium microadriaticum]